MSTDEKIQDVTNPTIQPVLDAEVHLSPKLIRKMDLHILPCLALLYLISYMDRGSLANASILGYKTALHLKANQYNLISTAFFIPYALCGIPSQIIIQRVRPSLWLGLVTAAWGTVTTLSGIVQNFGGAFASRFCLGITEAAFFPAAMMIVAMWYPRRELQKRVAAFYATGILSGSFIGLLAYAITYMEGVGGLANWRWLFILEGIATVLLSAAVLLGLPDSPERARWLTDEEKEAIKRVRAAAGSGTMERIPFKWVDFWQAVTDIRVLCCTWLCMCVNIPVIGFSYTLPTILVQLGYTAAKAQLMTVPIYAVAAICVVVAAYYGDRMGKRSIGAASGFTVGLIGLIALYSLPHNRLPGVSYFFCMWVPGGLYAAYPSVLSWCSNNTAGKGKKSMAVTFQLVMGSLSVAAGNNSYLAQQAPKYQLGFGLGIAMCASGIVVVGLLTWILRRDNLLKENVDISQYNREQLEEMGDKAPNFIYVL